MFNPNDPVGKATEMAAKLFALIADEVLRNCGEEEGSQIVRKAVRRYGLMRGETIRANILADGKELTFENAEAYSDYPPNQAWDCESQVEGNCLREVNRVCPFSAAFRALGLEQVGKLYCEEIDLALNQAIFGNIRFERPRLFTDGPDAPCEMIVTKL